MPRLSKTRDVEQSTLSAARELLSTHAARRIAVKLNDGHITKILYDSGIPVEEIASAYQVGTRTIYDILKRQPTCAHNLPAGDACTICGTVCV